MVQCEVEHGGCGEWYHTRCILDEIQAAVSAGSHAAAAADAGAIVASSSSADTPGDAGTDAGADAGAGASADELELPDLFVCKLCIAFTNS